MFYQWIQSRRFNEACHDLAPWFLQSPLKILRRVSALPRPPTLPMMLRAKSRGFGSIHKSFPLGHIPLASRVPTAQRSLSGSAPLARRVEKEKREPVATTKPFDKRKPRQKRVQKQGQATKRSGTNQTAQEEHTAHDFYDEAAISFPDTFVTSENDGLASSPPLDASSSSSTANVAWMTLAERLQQGSVSHIPPALDSSVNQSISNASITERIESELESTSKDSAPRRRRQRKKKSAPTGDNGSGQVASRRSSSETGAEDSVKKPRTKKESSSEIVVIWPNKIRNKPVETDAELEVPRLQHNLDRVLFNPGVHVMRDPRSRVYNFDPDIATIMPADEFDYDALGEYITSSKDEKLRGLCAKYQKKYCGSTSSMSSILAHFHFLLSAWRKPNFGHLSREIRPDSQNFTQLLRSPAAAFAHYRDGSYAIDADKEYDVDNILSSLGKSMEKHLLLPKDEYEKYRLSRSHEIPQEQKDAAESYHYSELGDFLVRSQLDAYDPRLPGTGVFDLKTRAVVSVRMDVQRYEKGTDYEINKLYGKWDSFEREYMDMIRAAFLKYSLQVRMGRMDGIFCAYHNTRRIFGFQYIPLEDLDFALHGTNNTKLGDEEFKASLTILNKLLDRGTQRWPGRTLRLHVETRDTAIPLMYFFIQPVTDEQMEAMQSANKSSAAASAAKVVKSLKDLEETLDETEAVERRQDQHQTENPTPTSASEMEEKVDDTSKQDFDRDEVWEELEAKVEDVVENDSNGLEFVRTAVIDAMDRHGLLEGKSETEVERSVHTLVEALVGARAGWTSKLSPSHDQVPESGEAVEPKGTTGFASATEIEESFTGTPDGDSGMASAAGAQMAMPLSEGHEAIRVEEDITSPAVDAATAAAVDVDSSATLDAATSSLGLKELIFRATKHAELQSSDSRAFDRIIAELSAEARGRDDEKSPMADDVGQPARPSSEPSQTSTNTPGASSEGQSNISDSAAKGSTSELLGMVITVRNKVDGKMAERPCGGYATWSVGYSVTELESERAWRVYRQLKARRSNALRTSPEKRHRSWYTMFDGNLEKATNRGKRMRENLEKEDYDAQSVKVAWDEAPQPRKTSAQAE